MKNEKNLGPKKYYMVYFSESLHLNCYTCIYPQNDILNWIEQGHNNRITRSCIIDYEAKKINWCHLRGCLESFILKT